jgi:hypothetical protein
VSANSFEELQRHYGHKLSVVEYGDMDGRIVNISAECNDCHEVIMDYDREEE